MGIDANATIRRPEACGRLESSMKVARGHYEYIIKPLAFRIMDMESRAGRRVFGAEVKGVFPSVRADHVTEAMLAMEKHAVRRPETDDDRRFAEAYRAGEQWVIDEVQRVRELMKKDAR